MKTNKKKSVKAPETDDLQKLKVGVEVLYMTNYTLDRCTVEEISIKEDLAILSNRVRTSRLISSSGRLTMKGNADQSKTILRIWSPEVEVEFNYQLALRSIPNLTRSIDKLAKDMGREDVITLHKKLNKIINKYE